MGGGEGRGWVGQEGKTRKRGRRQQATDKATQAKSIKPKKKDCGCSRVAGGWPGENETGARLSGLGRTRLGSTQHRSKPAAATTEGERRANERTVATGNAPMGEERAQLGEGARQDVDGGSRHPRALR